MIRLVALDLDGTLYAGPHHGVPESAWQAIQEARQAGLHFAVCTGRPLGGYGLEYATRLGPEGPHVYNDGSTIVTATGQPLHSVPLPHLERLIALSREYRLPLELLSEQGSRFYEQDLVGLEHHIAFTGIGAQQISFDDIGETINRGWFVVPQHEHWYAHKPLVQGLDGLELSEYPLPHSVVTGLNQQGITKASGLAWLAQWYGIGLENVCMIGDGQNDLEAIQAAGLGIAMGNSEPQILQVADYVTDHVREDGLAKAIRYILQRIG